jgi:hypothetical protein
MDIWDFLDLVEEGVKEHWKVLLIFLFLLVTGIAGTLYSAIDQVEDAEQTTKNEVSDGVISAFSDTGDELAKGVDDPALSGVIKFGMVIAGLLFVVAIFLRIGEIFKPLIEGLNPVNIAKNFGR